MVIFNVQKRGCEIYWPLKQGEHKLLCRSYRDYAFIECCCEGVHKILVYREAQNKLFQEISI